MWSLKICLLAAALTATSLSATPAALARDGGTDHGSSQGNGRVTFTTQNTSAQNFNKIDDKSGSLRGFINELKAHEVKQEKMNLIAEYSALRAKAIQVGPNSPLFKTLTAKELQIAAKFRTLGGAPELLGPLS